MKHTREEVVKILSIIFSVENGENLSVRELCSRATSSRNKDSLYGMNLALVSYLSKVVDDLLEDSKKA